MSSYSTVTWVFPSGLKYGISFVFLTSVNFFDKNGNAITDSGKNYISGEDYLYTLNQGTSTDSNKLVLSKEAMISGVAADISNTDVSKSIVKGDTQLDIWGAVKDSNGD